jgi:hypothetical protein
MSLFIISWFGEIMLLSVNLITPPLAGMRIWVYGLSCNVSLQQQPYFTLFVLLESAFFHFYFNRVYF